MQRGPGANANMTCMDSLDCLRLLSHPLVHDPFIACLVSDERKITSRYLQTFLEVFFVIQ